MKRRLTIIAIPSLALACLLMLAGSAYAQRNTYGYEGSVIFPPSRSYGRGYRAYRYYNPAYAYPVPYADTGTVNGYQSFYPPSKVLRRKRKTPATLPSTATRAFIPPAIRLPILST